MFVPRYREHGIWPSLAVQMVRMPTQETTDDKASRAMFMRNIWVSGTFALASRPPTVNVFGQPSLFTFLLAPGMQEAITPKQRSTFVRYSVWRPGRLISLNNFTLSLRWSLP